MFKKEVYVTQSIEKISRIKDVLKQHHIPFKVQVSDREFTNFTRFNAIFAPSHRSRGTLLEKDEFSKFYYVLVNKKDMEEAQHLIQHIK